MRRTNYLSGVLLCFVVLFLMANCNGKINVSNFPQISRAQKGLKEGKNLVTFSVFRTGRARTQEAFVYSGGSLFRKCDLSHIAIWVKHPDGDFLFDTGLGDSIDVQFEEMSLIHK